MHSAAAPPSSPDVPIPAPQTLSRSPAPAFPVRGPASAREPRANAMSSGGPRPGTGRRTSPDLAHRGRGAYQRTPARSTSPCSGASSLAASRRVASSPRLTSGPSFQRAPARNERSPSPESPSPA